ncbi:formate dehydrogenase subunit gamma [Rhodoligotrophos sp. lm1]|uniref:formate dehydrogenase subunit gamma n=1 Tax=Rhodoligotrophos defluvii TaxID=2561934 RepID=UPI0010C9D383
MHPAERGLDEDSLAAIDAITARHGNRPDALIEIYHEVQEALGHIPEGALPRIARALNISRAEARGVFTFYHDFRDRPAGRHVIKLCRAEACQSMGCRSLEAHAKQRLGIGMGETTGDGEVTLEAVYCLGNCALSPAVMIDGRLYGRVDATRFDALVDEFKRRAAS